MSDEPPDAPDPELLKKAARKAYDDARLEAAAARNRMVTAFDAWMKLVEMAPHTPPPPRPKGVVVARKGKWQGIEALPWYHPRHIAEFVLLAVLAILVLSGVGFWLWYFLA